MDTNGIENKYPILTGDNMSDNIISDDMKRTMGRSAQQNNILAAKIVADTIRTTLGPKGMDKMIVDSFGDVIITNDGVTILNEIQIEHPAAKMIVEVAKTQETEVGDGTTTSVILAGEFLKNAEDLIDQNIHPTIIVRGYRLALKKSLEILKNISKNISFEDKEILYKIAKTAMTGKGAEYSKEHLAKIVVDSVHSIYKAQNSINRDDIKIEKIIGGSIEDSKLVNGIVLEKEIAHPQMDKKIENAKILLLDTPIEIRNTEIDAKITINDPLKMQSFYDMEENMLKEMVDKIKKIGTNIVICQKGIDEMAQHFLYKNDIVALRRVSRSNLEKISKATSAQIINNLDDMTSNDLGYAKLFEEKIYNDEKFIFISECQNSKALSIVVRGSTEHVVDEVKRAIDDALGDVISAIECKKTVTGAASSEIELALKLSSYADTLKGKEQLAVKAYAKSLEVIPKTLAENAGIDPIDVITDLKSMHDNSVEIGIDVYTGKPINAYNEGIIEPLKVKTQALNSATEVTNMILRIDDVILSGKNNSRDVNPIENI
jgi:thermosome